MPGSREAPAALGLAASALVADAAVTAQPRDVGLALSCGGLHGLVHAGEIRALQGSWPLATTRWQVRGTLWQRVADRHLRNWARSVA